MPRNLILVVIFGLLLSACSLQAADSDPLQVSPEGESTATVATTAANFTDNLMDQRRRDFFLDGHRMGDLRRYRNKNSTDLWEKGAMYGTTVTFNDQTCWPMNVAEISARCEALRIRVFSLIASPAATFSVPLFDGLMFSSPSLLVVS